MSNNIEQLFTLKASYKEDIRRFSVPLNINFTELTERVLHLFNLNNNSTHRNSYDLFYLDNENDWIKLSSDVELEEAKRFLVKNENTTLRLEVRKIEKENVKEEKCEFECPLQKGINCCSLKYLAIPIFIIGFFCRPYLGIAFLISLFLWKRHKSKSCGVTAWKGCKWNKCGDTFGDMCGKKWQQSFRECGSSVNDEEVKEEKKNEKVDEFKEEKVEEEKKEENKEDKSEISWSSLLKKLQDMGFADTKQNIQLLKKHRGNIDSVVAEIVQLAN